MQHYCGVVGAIAADSGPSELDIPRIVCRALNGLQHRGQESAGIVTSYGGVNANDLYECRGHGLINQIFTEYQMTKLKGNLGVGHTRYSTHGSKDHLASIQPFVVDTVHGLLAVSHNGQLINATKLRKQVLKRGVGLSSHSDSELITQALSLSHPDDPDEWPSRIRHFMETCPTSYSLVIMHADKLYAVRDPYGNRPLSLGKLNRLVGDVADPTQAPVGWIVASESCPFFSIGGQLVREVLPGEIIEISRKGFRSLGVVSPKFSNQIPTTAALTNLSNSTSDQTSTINAAKPLDNTGDVKRCHTVAQNAKPAFCIFEYVYFARSDSYFEGQSVYTVRRNCGRHLAMEAPVDADIISVVPESANPAALGYSQYSGIPYLEVLCKNRYEGRSFIQPSTRLRQLAVARKFGPILDNISGKRIVLVDDSIVRGNTMQLIIALLKSCGAIEIHVRIASPPVKHPCYMGINIPTREELLANRVPIEDLPEYLGATSVKYLTIEGLLKAVTENIPEKSSAGHCAACLTGQYPVDLDW